MNIQDVLKYSKQTLSVEINARAWPRKLWYHTGRLIVKLISHLLYKMDVKYECSIPTGSKILAANHPCTVDPILMTSLVPELVSILILETLFKVPVVGASLRASGHIRVNLDNGKEALAQGIEKLKQGQTVGIFPEGIISPLEGGFHRPRTGVARLALSSGAPVIPIGIALDPARVRQVITTVKGQPEVGTWYSSGPYAMTVGEPMFFKGDPEDRRYVQYVAEQIMQRIAALAEASAARIRESAALPLIIPNPLDPVNIR